MTYRALAVALMISVVASPAVAKGTADQKSSEQQASVDKKKYCIKFDEVTGSRISRDDCRTKKEWAAEGVEVEERKSK